MDICTQTDDGEVCAYQAAMLDTATLISSTYVYDDAPVTPLPLGQEQGCQVGKAVHRVFSVAEDFSVADVEIGLRIPIATT